MIINLIEDIGDKFGITHEKFAKETSTFVANVLLHEKVQTFRI